MIPRQIQPFLWSYDLARLDLQKHKKRIITNILNLGDVRALRWLFQFYSESEIKAVVKNISLGEWSRKSLNFWKLFFHIEHHRISKRV